MNRRKSSVRTPPLVLVLDIETVPFTMKFKRASTFVDRLECCPEIRLAGTYNSITRKYSFYTPTRCSELIRALLEADIIVTFNGNQFDLLVLRRHGGLSQRNFQRIQEKHADLYEIINRETGQSYSLNDLARTNLDERKRVHGRAMCNLNLIELKEANRSDLSQTYRLYRRWKSGRLIHPYRWIRPSGRNDDAMVDGIHSQLPPRAYVDLNTEEMTEGQMAEYRAGTWGITVGGDFVEM